MKTRDIALIGLLSASITAGKLALSFIPNVEIVTLLFILYTIIFGYKKSIFVSIVFTTTEILIYGVSTWIIVYYFIWVLLIIITALMKNKFKSEYGYATLGAIFGYTFGMFFAIFESFFYGASYGWVYWLRGIPFDIIHGTSNFIIILVLFKPLTKILGKLERLYYN